MNKTSIKRYCLIGLLGFFSPLAQAYHALLLQQSNSTSSTHQGHFLFQNYSNYQPPALRGCYTVSSGHIATNVVSQTQQLGEYIIKLTSIDWPSLSASEKSQTLFQYYAMGQVLGTITDMDATTGAIYSDHILSETAHRGMAFSSHDLFTPTAQPAACNSTGGYTVDGVETIQLIQATGVFSTLDSSTTNTVELQGTVNSCTGQNDFDVTGGTICFDQ